MRIAFIRPVRFISVGMLLLWCQVSAAPVGKQVVATAVDRSDAKIVRLEVRFNMPVKYLWHYPKTGKNICFIAIQPMTGEEQYDLASRQKVSVPAAMGNLVANLSYDGTDANNRFLVLETRKAAKVTLTAAQTTNSLIIEMSGVEARPAAEGTNKTGKEGQSSSKK